MGKIDREKGKGTRVAVLNCHVFRLNVIVCMWNAHQSHIDVMPWNLSPFLTAACNPIITTSREEGVRAEKRKER